MTHFRVDPLKIECEQNMKMAIRAIFDSKVCLKVMSLLLTVDTLQGGGQQGQRSVIPGKHFPSQSTKETREFLKLIFGVDRKHLPSAAEMLHDATVFK